MKEWYDAPRDEALIDKSKLSNREIIMSRNNNAIVKWLDSQYEDHANVMKTLKQQTGQLLMFSFLIPVENRRQNNSAFQNHLQEARRAKFPTSSNMVDGDQSSEESLD